MGRPGVLGDARRRQSGAQVQHGPFPSSRIYHRPDTSRTIVDLLAGLELYTQKRFFDGVTTGLARD